MLFRVIFTLLLLLLWLGVIFGTVFLIHFFLTLPMRRAERARLFLDLLEGALNRGQSVEEMILSVAQSRDRTVGVRFHLLAAHIESGLSFVAALEKVPRFLPPQISAMLRAGEKLGDLKKVLPACREILRDRPAAVRSAMNYLIVVILLFSPVFIFVVMMTMVFVIPKFKDVAAGMGVHLWPLTLFVFANTNWLIAFEIIISFLMIVAVLLYVGGPQFVRWFQFRTVPIVRLDRVADSVETKTAATHILRHARRAAGRRRAGSRGRPAGGQLHGQRNLPPPFAARHRRD